MVLDTYAGISMGYDNPRGKVLEHAHAGITAVIVDTKETVSLERKP